MVGSGRARDATSWSLNLFKLMSRVKRGGGIIIGVFVVWTASYYDIIIFESVCNCDI